MDQRPEFLRANMDPFEVCHCPFEGPPSRSCPMHGESSIYAAPLPKPAPTAQEQGE